MPTDDYPTEEELERIRTWKPTDCEGLWDLIRSIWHWAPLADVEGGMWRLATGGWSGNEDIVQAMNDNRVFWGLCWQRSERGGLHWFKPWVEMPSHMNAADLEYLRGPNVAGTVGRATIERAQWRADDR